MLGEHPKPGDPDLETAMRAWAQQDPDVRLLIGAGHVIPPLPGDELRRIYDLVLRLMAVRPPGQSTPPWPG